jgi:hypothetical protein
MFNKKYISSITISRGETIESVLSNEHNSPLIDEMILTNPNVKYDFTNLPITVRKLIFHYTFVNNPTDIPEFVKEVEFYYYVCPLENLPTNINHVIISNGFNHPVDNLGNNFITIGFGDSFNQDISNLPSSLEKIILGYMFTHSINNLPDSIKFLRLHNPNYEHNSIQKLPKSIILFQIGIRNIDLVLNLNSSPLDKKHYHIREKNFGLSCDATGCDYFNNFYFY